MADLVHIDTLVVELDPVEVEELRAGRPAALARAVLAALRRETGLALPAEADPQETTPGKTALI
ncbi:MAG: hypothetical protein ABW000_15485 [Actinoplanes sp.]